MNVNKEELITRLSTSMEFQMVSNLTGIIESNDLKIADLLDISFHKKKEVAFRAAWMLEYLMTHKPDLFVGYMPELISLLAKQKNPSAMRHYAKIIALLTDRKAHNVYKDKAATTDFEPVIDILFTWLVDTEVLVATKVHCMQTLANLSPRYDWIKDELLETIDYLVDIESVAFFGRAKQIRRQLKKIQKKV
ncbi:hypothetical protein [Pedobacter sp. V48]|uniref:hypothetical protein n=1 Tax=Pedobacter sp. V48 TaxID=509635 RepID=UPI0003E5597A|nr:hypothetical protein [Pedobacter sp. V48]ETZ20704.1 hypothetical protein N824_03725 [Pedobacter sp. V48]